MTFLWWQWLVLGLALMAAELATPGGFYVIFFGLSAVIVGLLAGVGLAGPLGMQLLLFSALTVGFLILFRRRVLRWFQSEPQRPPVDRLVGEVGTSTEDLAPGQVGRVELHGSTWSARNGSAHAILRGARVTVTAVDGLMLFVELEGVR